MSSFHFRSNLLILLERQTRFELATLSLGSAAVKPINLVYLSDSTILNSIFLFLQFPESARFSVGEARSSGGKVGEESRSGIAGILRKTKALFTAFDRLSRCQPTTILSALIKKNQDQPNVAHGRAFLSIINNGALVYGAVLRTKGGVDNEVC